MSEEAAANTEPSAPTQPAPVKEAAAPEDAGSAAPLLAGNLPAYLLVFLSSMGIMVIEILAGRLIGRHLGSSLYTWTAVIGVVMAGMSVGSYFGGKLADKRRPEQLLPILLGLSGLSCLLTLGLNALMAGPLALRFLNWPPRIFLTVLVIFILPAFFLGTIVPVTAKLAVERTRRVGRTLGSLYALSAAGSILGALLTGFYLVAVMGVTALIAATSVALGLLGLAFHLVQGRLVAPPPQAGEPEPGTAVPEETAPPENSYTGLFRWRYAPHLVVFFSAGALLAMELAAPRLIARHLGSSIYTWSAIIGVVLLGMSIGYYLGGRLADRWRPERFLGLLCQLSALACLMALSINHFFTSAAWTAWSLKWSGLDFSAGPTPWPLRILLTTFCAFLLPSLILGMISPAAARLALSRSRTVGRTIGSVYAWGTVGSIFGTLLTGFFLIGWLGAPGVVLAAAVGLSLLGYVLGPCRAAHLVGLLIVALALQGARLPNIQVWSGTVTASTVEEEDGRLVNVYRISNALGDLKIADPEMEQRFLELAEAKSHVHITGHRQDGGRILVQDLSTASPSWNLWKTYACWAKKFGFNHKDDYHLFCRDSDYQYVKVSQEYSEKSSRDIRKLALDYLIHGYVDLVDPGHLEYDYEQVYADVARRFAEGMDEKPRSAFFIGGGSYTFPRWLQKEWPGSDAHVAEIDPVVKEANHAAMGLPRDTTIRTSLGDARNVVDGLPPGDKYDFFFGDAFNDLSVPWHLTTLEFARAIHQHLRPQGAYLINVIDDYKYGLFLGACYLTLKKEFRHVYVFCTEKEGVSEGRRDTFVVAASDVELEVGDWLPGHDTKFEGAVLTAEQLDKLEKKCRRLVLTDDHAPVENLLEPMVRSRK